MVRIRIETLSDAKAGRLPLGLTSRDNLGYGKQGRQMTAQAGATLNVSSWGAIDWQTVESNVRRLQVRIVKALKEGRWNRVRALQHLLTHSASGKLLATRRVTENDGRRTPGVDGELWDSPNKKLEGSMRLCARGYCPKPLKRIYIPKANGKLRPLGIPTMRDRAMQALYLLALDPVAETHADHGSYGFRVGRSCADAIEHCFHVFTRPNPEWVLEGDIKGCFDNISHDWLLANVPMDKVMLKKWLVSGYLEKQVFHNTISGTPQGGIISPVLANLTLDGLEKLLREAFPRKGPGSDHGRRANVNFIRYADDFIITGRSRELLELTVKPLVEAFMAERGLVLSSEKTIITKLSVGFDFLGQNVRRYPNGKLLIKPARKSIESLLNKVREIVSGHQASPAHLLIARLNPIIRGWATYHRHVVSKRIFAYVDYRIFECLWRWATARHPKKGLRWTKRKYFERVGTRDWIFFGDQQAEDGSVLRLRLFHASSMRIKRHVMVRSALNPYDPEWAGYIAKRAANRSPVSVSRPWTFAEA